MICTSRELSHSSMSFGIAIIDTLPAQLLDSQSFVPIHWPLQWHHIAQKSLLASVDIVDSNPRTERSMSSCKVSTVADVPPVACCAVNSGVLTPHAGHQLGEAPQKDGEGVAQLIGAGLSPPGVVSLQTNTVNARCKYLSNSSLND